MNLKVVNATPLNETGCSYWASMPYWHFSDVIFLSMGFDPSGINSVEFDEETASKLGHDFDRRFALLRRAMDLNQIETRKFPSEFTGGDTLVFPPEKVTNWAIKNLPSFPTELINAVTSRFEENESETKTKSSRRNGYYLHGLAPLNESRLSYWAALAYWSSFEALLLSLGYDPTSSGFQTDEDTALKLGDEIVLRGDTVLRATCFGQLKKFTITNDDGDEPDNAYTPEAFSKWADKNLPSFPPELFNAVIQHTAAQQSKVTESGESACKANFQDVVNPVDGVPTAEVNATNESLLAAEKTVKGNPGSDGRWSKRDKIVDIAVDAMKYLVNSHCKCRHDRLANFVYEHGNDCRSFKDLDAKGYNLLKQFKIAALDIVPEERQFGNDHDPNKSKKYNPASCICEIREHKHFKPS